MKLLKCDFIYGTVLALFCFVVASYLCGMFDGGELVYNWYKPLLYDGDGIGAHYAFKRLVDGIWYYSSDFSGYPFNSDNYDFAQPEIVFALFMKFLSFFIQDTALAVNLILLLSFPVVAVTSYVVLRSIDIDRIFAFTFSILFCFVFFHFGRFGHTSYTYYIIPPIIFYLCNKLYSQTPLFFANEKIPRKIFYIVLLLICSGITVYYSFFGVILLCATTIAALCKFKNKKHLFSGLILVGIIIFSVAAQVLPTKIYSMQYGENKSVAARLPFEVELYGLRIGQMLIPQPSHRIDGLRLLSSKYHGQFNFSENIMSSQGIFLSIGLLAFLAIIVLNSTLLKDKRFYLASFLGLVCILYAELGGFATLFNTYITPSIRAVNRISIFISFFSAVTLALLSNKYCKKKGNIAFIIISLIIIPIAIYDNTASSDNFSKNNKWNSDKQYVEQIERVLPKGSAIYQIPYIAQPEMPPLHGLGEYEHLALYLHSKDLKWSSGVMKGRPGDYFFNALNIQSLDNQIEIAKKLGFSGISVDLRGYADGGESIKSELINFFGIKPEIVSNLGNLIYYSFKSKPDQVAIDLAKNGKLKIYYFDSSDDILNDNFNINFSEPQNKYYTDGLSNIEDWGRWTDGNEVKIILTEKLLGKYKFNFTFHPFTSQVGKEVKIQVGNNAFLIFPEPQTALYSFEIYTENPINTITITLSNPMSPRQLSYINSDNRKLGIGLTFLNIEKIE